MTNITLPLAALEFLSFAMLGWTAAGLLPWLIHRLYRRNHHTTAWAAVELLLAAIEERGRQIRLQQWLLLALRTAILLLVAFSAAQPVWRQWPHRLGNRLGSGGAGGGNRVHRVLVIDCSYSMACRHEGSSLLQQAQEHARRLIDGAAAVTIIAWGGEAESVMGRPTLEPSLALSAAESLGTSYGRADLRVALHTVEAALDRAEQQLPQFSEHQVFFLSDMGRNTWLTGETEETDLCQLAQRARLTVIDVGSPQRENVALADLTIEPKAVLRGQEAMISATLHNFGHENQDDLQVEIKIDGRTIGSQSVDLPAKSSQVVNFAHQFIDAAQVTITAAVPPGTDCLPVDDRRWLVVDVRPQQRVACLEGRPRAAEDVARALSFAQGAIAPEVFPANRLSTLDLTTYDAVLLADVLADGAQLSPRESAQLAQYVHAGGALAVLLGEEPAHWDLLPVEIVETSAEGTYRFDPLEYGHPVVQPFRGREQAGLLSVVISRYVRMRASKQAETVLALDTGDPALVVAKRGLGSVAVLAIPGSLATRPQKPWSSFAVSPSFLPVMRELLSYLVGDPWLRQRNLQPGERAMTIWQAAAGDQPIEVRLPSGRSVQLPLPGAEDKQQVVFTETGEIGLYSLRMGAEQVDRFAVNLDAASSLSDSDLTRIAPGQLPPEIQATGLAAETQLAATDFSLARTLLACAVLLLFAEQTLAWLLGRGWA